MDKASRKKKEIRSRGSRLFRFSSVLALLLAGVMTLLLMMVARRLDRVWELPVAGISQVSDRTCDILSDTQGTVRISCFMDRRHPMFRPLSRLLRGFREAARKRAGAELQIEYVDPHWDLIRAGQLAALKIPENSVVFERNRRRVVVTLDEMLTRRSVLRIDELATPDPVQFPTIGGQHADLGVFRGEGVCASAISRLALPYDRATVYWLTGHGEVRFDDYDALYGYSDIAREIKREGFNLRTLSLAAVKDIPPDCHVLVIAGARTQLLRGDAEKLEKYLLRGGRLLCLLSPLSQTGLDSILAKWGVSVRPFVAVSPQTQTGDEVYSTSYGTHVITRNLENSPVVFGRSACLEALANVTVGADCPKVTPLVSSDEKGWGESTPAVLPRRYNPDSDLKGPVQMAVASEWGANASTDIAFKPTRICVFGEVGFVMNGTLATRANANRDLFLNALSWLAGVDTGSSSSLGGDATLFVGLPRQKWMGLAVVSTVALPGIFFLLFCLFGRPWRYR